MVAKMHGILFISVSSAGKPEKHGLDCQRALP